MSRRQRRHEDELPEQGEHRRYRLQREQLPRDYDDTEMREQSSQETDPTTTDDSQQTELPPLNPGRGRGIRRRSQAEEDEEDVEETNEPSSDHELKAFPLLRKDKLPVILPELDPLPFQRGPLHRSTPARPLFSNPAFGKRPAPLPGPYSLPAGAGPSRQPVRSLPGHVDPDVFERNSRKAFQPRLHTFAMQLPEYVDNMRAGLVQYYNEAHSVGSEGDLQCCEGLEAMFEELAVSMTAIRNRDYRPTAASVPPKSPGALSRRSSTAMSRRSSVMTLYEAGDEEDEESEEDEPQAATSKRLKEREWTAGRYELDFVPPIRSDPLAEVNDRVPTFEYVFDRLMKGVKNIHRVQPEFKMFGEPTKKIIRLPLGRSTDSEGEQTWYGRMNKLARTIETNTGPMIIPGSCWWSGAGKYFLISKTPVDKYTGETIPGAAALVIAKCLFVRLIVFLRYPDKQTWEVLHEGQDDVQREADGSIKRNTHSPFCHTCHNGASFNKRQVFKDSSCINGWEHGFIGTPRTNTAMRKCAGQDRGVCKGHFDILQKSHQCVFTARRGDGRFLPCLNNTYNKPHPLAGSVGDRCTCGEKCFDAAR